ncbi:hypothetical protein VA7868_00402 [Vibrio aerogenes CECT 7868]|uniref:Uncharacterized protein n=1 Tax=Vibrio aerogenes CECT 7868 TaxID=1216006 RepID=A0A1M5VIE3_9VIBR|nr:hypothetical protein VA7868_00402 [Vibrio aerogenes CECT 7868]
MLKLPASVASVVRQFISLIQAAFGASAPDGFRSFPCCAWECIPGLEESSSFPLLPPDANSLQWKKPATTSAAKSHVEASSFSVIYGAPIRFADPSSFWRKRPRRFLKDQKPPKKSFLYLAWVRAGQDQFLSPSLARKILNRRRVCSSFELLLFELH